MTDFVVTAQVRADARQFRSELQHAERSTKRLGAAAGGVRPRLKGVGGDAALAANRINQLSGNSTRLRASFGGLRTAAAALGLGLIGKSIVRANADFQRLSAALETVSGSSAAAQRAMAWMDEFSTETPFQLEEIIDGYTKLSARGLTPTKRVMTSLGDTASAMGKSLNQMIEAVADATTSEFERLKEFGIKASQQGEEVVFTYRGVSTEVKNTNKAIQDYLVKLGETHNLGAMIKQMDTLGGAFSNLGVATSRWQRALGDAGFNQALQATTNRLGESMNASHGAAKALGGSLATALGVASDAAWTLGPWITRLTIALLAGRGAGLAAAAILSRLTKLHGRYRKALTKSTASQVIWRRSLRLLGGPFGAIITAVTGLWMLNDAIKGVGKVTEKTEFDKITEGLGDITEKASEGREAIIAQARAMRETIIRDLKENYISQRELTKEIEDNRATPLSFLSTMMAGDDLSMYGGAPQLAQLNKLAKEQSEKMKKLTHLTISLSNANETEAKQTAEQQAEQSKKAKELLADLAKRIDYQQRLNAVLGDGAAAQRRVEAEIAADKLLAQLGDKATDRQRQEARDQTTIWYEVKSAAEDYQKRQEELQELAERHADTTANIRSKLLSYSPVYERLAADAYAWRQEALAGLNATAAGYDNLRGKVQQVYGHQLADARQKDLASSLAWQDGITRGLQAVSAEAKDMATQSERGVTKLASGMEDAFADIVTGAKTGSDAFRSFADSVIRDLARMTFREQVTGKLSGILGSAISGMFGGSPEVGTPEWHQRRLNAAKGRAFSRGGEEVTRLASGGIVNAPTFFRHARGVGLMGEAGPEAVLPLTRLPGGRLGVQSKGGGITMPPVTININNHIHVHNSGGEAVEELIERKIAEKIPYIIKKAVEVTFAKIINEANKGGNFSRIIGRRR